MPLGRAIATLIAHLAVGAAVTVAVSWGLACMDIKARGQSSAQRIRPTRGPVVQELMGGPHDGIAALVYQRPGRVLVFTWCYGPEFQPLPGIPGDPHMMVDTEPDLLVPIELRPRAFPWLDGQPWAKSRDCDWREVAASGWPFYALSSGRGYADASGRQAIDGIEVGGMRAYDQTFFFAAVVPRILPLRPLPLGFAADTLLYAGAFRGLTILLAGARRSWRRRRGRCPGCGYDRRGLAEGAACPECGRAAGTGASA
jgi:hypothetical protein